MHDAYASTVTLFAKLSSPQVDFRNFLPHRTVHLHQRPRIKMSTKFSILACLFLFNLNQIYFSRHLAHRLISPEDNEGPERIDVIALRRIISKSVERTASHLRRSLVECLAGLLRHSRTVIRGQRSRVRGPARGARRRRVSSERARRNEGERRRRRRRTKEERERGFLNKVRRTRFPSSSECGDILAVVSSDARLICAHGIDGYVLAK